MSGHDGAGLLLYDQRTGRLTQPEAFSDIINLAQDQQTTYGIGWDRGVAIGADGELIWEAREAVAWDNDAHRCTVWESVPSIQAYPGVVVAQNGERNVLIDSATGQRSGIACGGELAVLPGGTVIVTPVGDDQYADAPRTYADAAYIAADGVTHPIVVLPPKPSHYEIFLSGGTVGVFQETLFSEGDETGQVSCQITRFDLATGAEVWTEVVDFEGLGGTYCGTPVLTPDIVVVSQQVSQSDVGVWVGLDATTGQERWRAPGSHVFDWGKNLYILNPGYLVAANGQTVNLVDPQSGNTVWSADFGEPITRLALPVQTLNEGIIVIGETTITRFDPQP